MGTFVILRDRHADLRRVARLAERLPMSASEIAWQAIGIDLDEIEKIVGETSSGLGAAAKLGARALGTAPEAMRSGWRIAHTTDLLRLHRVVREHPAVAPWWSTPG